jgi:hypothetical protein
MRLPERIALIAAVVVAAMATTTHLAKAQTSLFDVPDAGARIRVSRIGAAPTTGTLLAHTSDSIAIERPDGRRETMAMKDVTWLEISRGRTRNVAVGVALGLVAGAVVGIQLKKSGDRVTTRTIPFKSTDPNNLYLQASFAVADTSVGNPMWVPLGMLAGTAAGTIVGLFWKERWRPAMIRRGDAKVGLLPATNVRRLSLALSARF